MTHPRLPASLCTIPLAHRALHDVAQGRPENSRAAVTAALSHGYGIEIDLQASADGQAMVFHDDDLDRLTGDTGPVRAHSAARLGRISLTGADEGIPTLPEILNMIGGRVPVLIELKDQQGEMGETDGALEQATARALAGYRGPVGLMSFNPHMVARLAVLAPDIPRGLTTSAYDPEEWAPLPPEVCTRLRDIPDLARVGATFISHERADLARPLVSDLAADGIDILCWTVTSPAEEAEARRYARNITFEQYLAPLAG